MKVLSLFDGISGAQIALKQLGLSAIYFASEIEKNAIAITQHHFPKTIQLGDVTTIKYTNGHLYSENYPNGIKTGIDLVIGGSPCQGFSFSGKMLNFADPRSKLFFDFVRLVDEVKPKYFLLENVKMKNAWLKIISDHLDIAGVVINSNLVSAQNRPRVYWSNLKITQPIDKKIKLGDILEANVDPHFYIDKEIRPIIPPVAFTERRTAESKAIRRYYMKHHKRDFSPRRGKELVPRTDSKMNCLTATYSSKEHTIVDKHGRRKLTPLEWERLQTFPDNYTALASNTQRYKVLGNAFTVDVIAHVLKPLTR